MGFEWPGTPPCGWIESEGDGLCVLVSRVEGIAKVHEEGVAAPPEAVFDVRVGEPCAMEEVGSSDANRVAGPREQVLVSGGDVEDFVGDVPEENGELGSCDLASFPSGRVEVDRSWTVAGSAKAFCAPDYVEAGLCGAHPRRVPPAAIGEGLAIVIVFLLAKTECREGDVIVRRGVDVVDATSCSGGEAEVLSNDRHGWLAIAPVRVVDGVEGLVMVATPFGFSETGVAAECDPVCD